MEGHDLPAYVNTQYPWDALEELRPGEVPSFFNPVADYVTEFTLPEGFRGHELSISFQGVESGFAVWLNGTYLGYSEDSFTPADFAADGALREGRNRLAVRVFKWTPGSWFEDPNSWSEYCDQTIVGNQVAGVMNGNWIIPTIEQVAENSGKWALTTLPTLDGGKEGYAANGGSSLYITGNCKNVDLAKEFLAYTFGGGEGSMETYDNALRDGGVIRAMLTP